MKIILLKDVKNVGKKGETIEVSDGYANNFIIPKKFGVPATKRSLEILAEQNEDAKKKDEENRKEAEALAATLNTITLEFKVTAGSNGRMFGSISSKQVVEELRRKFNISVDKRKFLNTDGANVFGTTNFPIELYKGVIGTIRVHVTEKQK